MDPEIEGNSQIPTNKSSSKVKIERGEKKVELPISDINNLFQDIDKYNSKFSLGASLASMMIEHVNNINDEDESQKSPTNKIDEESQHMSASALDVVHKLTLDGLGLSLEPVSGKNTTIFTAEGVIGTGEIRLNIKDRNQFGSFLKALTPEQVEETPLEKHLESLTQVLNKQILDNYDLKQPDDNTLSFIASLNTIVEEYKRLGLGEKAKDMEEYLTHSRQGNLREFIDLKNSRLMVEPGNFGPADWQVDITPEGLQERWDQALHLLRTFREAPNAQEMYRKLLEHLNKCLPIAREGVSKITHYPSEIKQEMTEILKNQGDKLEGFEI